MKRLPKRSVRLYKLLRAEVANASKLFFITLSHEVRRKKNEFRRKKISSMRMKEERENERERERDTHICEVRKYEEI